MSKTSKNKTLPAYRIFSVTDAAVENGKTVWHELGAAWPHKDGKGFSLQFKALPLLGAMVVLREPTVKAEAEPKSKAKTSRGTLGRYDELNTADNGGAQ